MTEKILFCGYDYSACPTRSVPFEKDVVRREVWAHYFGIATASLVIRPVGPLTLPGTVVNVPATRADAQLRPGVKLATTHASASFRDLLPHSTVELLETGAREALGDEFYEVSTVATRQLVVHSDRPHLHHIPVRVRPEQLKQVDHDANHHLILSAVMEPVLPFDRRVVDQNIPNVSKQQVGRERSLALFIPNIRKAPQ